jgi:hypothetical protein
MIIESRLICVTAAFMNSKLLTMRKITQILPPLDFMCLFTSIEQLLQEEKKAAAGKEGRRKTRRRLLIDWCRFV